MSNPMQQIIAFSSGRYNENRDTRPGLAKAHLAIINRDNDVQFSTGNMGDMLDFLSQRQTDSDVAKACKEVLEHIGTTPG
jgi:hypothetical protein